MATQVTPKKNTAYSFTVCLVSQTTPETFQSSPTLAAGDVKVFKDFGASANIASLPTSDGKAVEVALSATEMNADRIVVLFSDAAGSEWCDLMVEIHTSTTNQIDDLSTLTTAQVNTEADTALADYDPPTKAELDSGLAALNDLTAAEVNAEVDTALADYDPPTKAELDAGFAALNDITVAEILAGTVSGAYTVNDSLHTVLIGFLSKTTGSTTTSPKFRDLADTADAITYTVDTSGNRTAVTEAI